MTRKGAITILQVAIGILMGLGLSGPARAMSQETAAAEAQIRAIGHRWDGEVLQKTQPLFVPLLGKVSRADIAATKDLAYGGDPAEALDWLKDNTPDLVVTDYKMPKMDGAEFVRRFRKLPECADVPAVVITVYEERSHRINALEAGATDFLQSPVDHHEFLTRARNLLKLRKQQLVIKSRATELERQSGALQQNSAKAGEDEVGLNALQREANAQRQLLETYLVRYREAASRADSNSSPADARVVSKAIQPVDPYFPKVVPIVIVAAFATLIITSIVIMLAELFSGRALRPVGPALPVARIEEEETVIVAAPAKTKRAVAPSMLSAPAEEPEAEEPAVAVEAVEENEFSIGSVADYLTGSRAPLAIAISPTGDDGSSSSGVEAVDTSE